MDYQAIVIGGGPAGYVSAIWLAKAGVKTCLIEGHKVGGTCLNYGCIPTKAYYHYAKLLQDIQSHQDKGIRLDGLQIDFEHIHEDKNATVFGLVSGVETLLKKNKVHILQGQGTFMDDHRISVMDTEGNSETVSGEYVLIATGSVPVIPPITGLREGMDLDFALTSKDALAMKEVPERMVIIGGGVIGMEFAGIMNAFGSSVVVIEALDHILPSFNKDLVKRYKPMVKKQGIELLTSSKVVEINGATKTVTYEDKKGIHTIACDKVLCAVGRKPFFDSLGLENLSSDITDGKKLVVDDWMKTDVDHIFGIGDVNGISLLAHSASKQGIIASSRVIDQLGFDQDGLYRRMSEKGFSAYSIPQVAFLMPEMAQVAGIVDDEKPITGKFMNRSNGMAMAAHSTDGLVKVEYSDKDQRLVYMGILGEAGAEMIHSGVHAIDHQNDFHELTSSITGHPSLSESIHEALLDIKKLSIHQL